MECKRPYAREMRRFVCAFRLRTYGVRSVNPALNSRLHFGFNPEVSCATILSENASGAAVLARSNKFTEKKTWYHLNIAASPVARLPQSSGKYFVFILNIDATIK